MISRTIQNWKKKGVLDFLLSKQPFILEPSLFTKVIKKNFRQSLPTKRKSCSGEKNPVL